MKTASKLSSKTTQKLMSTHEPATDQSVKPKLLIRPAEAAAALGVSDRLARYLMSNGYIKSRLVGTELRTSVKALEKFVEQLFDESDPLALHTITGKQYGSVLEISNLITNTTTQGAFHVYGTSTAITRANTDPARRTRKTDH